jgi:hypothetical protein
MIVERIHRVLDRIKDRDISFRNGFSVTGHLIEVIPRKVV